MYNNSLNLKIKIVACLLWLLFSPNILLAQEEEGADVPEKLIRALAKSLLRFESQKQEEDSTLLSSDNFLNLPPLEACIDSALIKHPRIKNNDIMISIRDREILSSRRSWQKYIFGEGTYRYGNIDQIVKNEANSDNRVFSTTDQLSYYGGLYIRFPLEEFLNRKNKIKIAEEQKELASIAKESSIRDIRNQIIMLYNEVLLNQQLVTAANSNQQELAQQVIYAQMEFEQHNITVEEYARIKDMFTKARIEFERARFGLNESYLLLQEIVGFKF